MIPRVKRIVPSNAALDAEFEYLTNLPPQNHNWDHVGHEKGSDSRKFQRMMNSPSEKLSFIGKGNQTGNSLQMQQHAKVVTYNLKDMSAASKRSQTLSQIF